MLLRYDALSSIINGTAQIPKDMTEDDEIITMLEGMKLWDFFFSLRRCQSVSLVLYLFFSFFFCAAAERREMRQKEGKLLEAAREGDISTLSNMV